MTGYCDLCTLSVPDTRYCVGWLGYVPVSQQIIGRITPWVGWKLTCSLLKWSIYWHSLYFSKNKLLLYSCNIVWEQISKNLTKNFFYFTGCLRLTAVYRLPVPRGILIVSVYTSSCYVCLHRQISQITNCHKRHVDVRVIFVLLNIPVRIEKLPVLLSSVPYLIITIHFCNNQSWVTDRFLGHSIRSMSKTDAHPSVMCSDIISKKPNSHISYVLDDFNLDHLQNSFN